MPKGAIVAIGGGSFTNRRRDWPSTVEIERLTLSLAQTRKPHPGKTRVLYVPTASQDDPRRIWQMQSYFRNLDCVVRTMTLTDPMYREKSLANDVAWADIVYVSGGNTRYLMKMWRRNGVDMLLKQAYERGAVLSGYSAGSICWFRGGWSDAEQDEGYNPWHPVWVKGLDLIPIGHSPHFGTTWRKKWTREEPEGITLALDNEAAIVYQDGVVEAVTARDGANIYLCKLEAGKYYEKVLPVGRQAPLSELTEWKPDVEDLAPPLKENTSEEESEGYTITS